MSNVMEWRNDGVKRDRWPKGEWDNEPDKIQWIDDATGLDCLMHRNNLGAWCGYVGVAEGHPAFAREYDDVPVDAHGGLTYSDFCQVEPEGEERPDRGICHIPLEGRPHKVWWLGFDCAHLNDLIPGMAETHTEFRSRYPMHEYHDIYRDRRYVEAEVAALAKQLAEMSR